MTLGHNEFAVNEENKILKTPPIKIEKEVYLPLDCIIETFGYKYSFDVTQNKATLINDNPDERKLPYAYCYKDVGKLGEIKDQGYRGTCWAMATVAAIETRLLPYEKLSLSVDHMSMNNSFKATQYDGGDYSMALAYLAAWQGPVLEKDDPYGDDITNPSLKPIKHVQEVQMIPSKDLEAIKMMVYKYGGVSTSLYTSLTSSDSSSRYYNKKTSSYCYIGEAKPNHEVVIVGWDDNYPKENFNAKLEGNGAFICQNSWGSEFGLDGLFYVSYYDTNIGIHNIVYTGVEDADNYDKIYQSDLCGWRGNLGYEKESAYFANVYRATTKETLRAVSFYAVDVDTYYEVYVCNDFDEKESLSRKRSPLASGTLKNAGYYTIPLEQIVNFEPGDQFAIIVYISTPNATRPVAVELKVDYKSSSVTLEDGEGYISYTGRTWENVEDKYNCNICLKGFADYR
jgi:C1A family cysteine protease